MSEIVPAEPIGGIYFERGETSTASASASETPHVTLAITNGSNNVEYVPEPFDSERLPTVFASEIQRFLRVANLLGKEEPRVAYLCFGTICLYLQGFNFVCCYACFLLN